jgi:hypothetical protein
LRFANVDPDTMTPDDRSLWTYFASLYKNSNKGIKGRGKDRKISYSTVLRSKDPDMKELPPSDDSSYDGGEYDDEPHKRYIHAGLMHHLHHNPYAKKEQ